MDLHSQRDQMSLADWLGQQSILHVHLALPSRHRNNSALSALACKERGLMHHELAGIVASLLMQKQSVVVEAPSSGDAVTHLAWAKLSESFSETVSVRPCRYDANESQRCCLNLSGSPKWLLSLAGDCPFHFAQPPGLDGSQGYPLSFASSYVDAFVLSSFSSDGPSPLSSTLTPTPFSMQSLRKHQPRGGAPIVPEFKTTFMAPRGGHFPFCRVLLGQGVVMELARLTIWLNGGNAILWRSMSRLPSQQFIPLTLNLFCPMSSFT
eukprot:6274406-Amphidinium_carterae.1